MCSHMRHIYGQAKGGFVMDKDITALWGVDINCGPAVITPVFSLKWWRKGVICKARAPLWEWQPQSITAFFSQIWETTTEKRKRKRWGERRYFPSHSLSADWLQGTGVSIVDKSSSLDAHGVDSFFRVDFEMTMRLTWGVRKSNGRRAKGKSVLAGKEHEYGRGHNRVRTRSAV